MSEFVLDDINLWHGDCLELMKNIPDGSVDMVLTDPPYGTTQCKWDCIIPLEPMWEQLKRIIKPNGAIVLTASQPFTSCLVMSNPKMFKYQWVWEKTQATGFFNAKKRPLVAHEDVCVFYYKPPTYNPQMTEGHKPINSYTKRPDVQNKTEVYGKVSKTVSGGGETIRFPRSVQVFPSDKQKNKSTKYMHPTQKPVALMEYMVKTYTNEGDLVLDFTMGSGTTGVACKNLKRDFIGIELDEGYFNIAKERILGSE